MISHTKKVRIDNMDRELIRLKSEKKNDEKMVTKSRESGEKLL